MLYIQIDSFQFIVQVCITLFTVILLYQIDFNTFVDILNRNVIDHPITMNVKNYQNMKIQ